MRHSSCHPALVSYHRLSVRVARLTATAAALHNDPVAEEQISLWSQGSLRSQHTVMLSQAAVQSGVKLAGTSSIANCGVHNAQRNLLNITDTIVEPYSIKLWLDIPGKTGRQLTECACINMYELFAALFHSGVLAFTIAFLGSGGEDSLGKFWTAAAGSDVFKDHPALSLPWESLMCIVPILLFFDGADIFRDKEFLWWLWSSAVSHGGCDWDTEFPLLCLDHANVASAETLRIVMQAVTEWLKWNFDILKAGIGPSKGYYGETLKTASMKFWAGKTLAGKFRAMFAGVTGDYKSRQEWQGSL